MESSKRREWVKTAAIIFLSVMLVLTFFSNTILNYSLPQVATQYVYGGDISATIRGTGTVTSTDPYVVEIAQTRVIASVKVHPGDVVAKGDVLYELEEGDSTEIDTAKKELETLQLAFEKSVLSSGVTSAMLNRVKNGSSAAFSDNQAKLEGLRKTIEVAKANVESFENAVAEIEKIIALLEKDTVDTTSEKLAVTNATNWVANATSAVTIADNNLAAATTTFEAIGKTEAAVEADYNAALAAYEAAQATPDPDDDVTTEAAYQDAADDMQLLTSLRSARTAKTNADNSLASNQAILATAQNALSAKQSSTTITDKITAYQKSLTEVTANLNKAKLTLTDAETEASEVLAAILLEMDLSAQYKAMAEKREQIAKLEEKAIGSMVVAPVQGTIVAMNFIAGNKAEAGSQVATIQPVGSEYNVTLTLTNEQVQKISVGDVATISNAWYYSDLQATVSAIKIDPSNPSKNKLVVCSLSGEVTAGQSLTLTLASNTAYYDLVVPNSSLHEDSNGKFILIVESKDTPLGNRYYATRVDVKILAADEKQSAISAAIEGYEYVITTSSMPLTAGQQVRLMNQQ